MSEFNKDDYLNDLPDADELAAGQVAPEGGAAEAQPETNNDAQSEDAQGARQEQPADEAATPEEGTAADSAEGELTPLGQAKKEAAEYLEALQRERAEFINYRNRTKKDMDRARQQGIIDVLAAELPALDDIDRIREHGGEMDESFQAVAAKIDKAFEKFGVEKFGVKGEDFDPTRHDAILHKPDPQAEKATVDTVVEAGYRIGDRVIRAARVVVASPQE
ncbi:nucleotide exchange factor GrpE [Bifidobacterium pseudolongum subsp. globosum]|uniref:Protein GrpE n=1 Tax=Bifidobacterium pseudolongum subsp. globosum TaxID=1690 RepID=A0A4Q4ZYQ7_9BIFI|nr:nucleotide exchange factor GrpE [Bifidobacterium pseudolongum]RYQ08494.1 nucleotide exchange factor GrpE [Bifidobacterium pseudolongum subsp. globosum]